MKPVSLWGSGFDSFLWDTFSYQNACIWLRKMLILDLNFSITLPEFPVNPFKQTCGSEVHNVFLEHFLSNFPKLIMLRALTSSKSLNLRWHFCRLFAFRWLSALTQCFGAGLCGPRGKSSITTLSSTKGTCFPKVFFKLLNDQFFFGFNKSECTTFSRFHFATASITLVLKITRIWSDHVWLTYCPYWLRLTSFDLTIQSTNDYL